MTDYRIESNIIYTKTENSSLITEELKYNNYNISTHFCMSQEINENILYERVDQEGAVYYIDLSNNELCFLDNTDFKKIKTIKYNNNSKTFSNSVKGKYCLFFDYDEENKKNIYVCLSNSETHKIIRYINDGKDIDNRDENEIKITNIKATKTKPLSKGWEARGYCVGLSEENKKLEIYRIINDKAIRFYTYIIENENEYIDEDSIKLSNAISLEDNLCIYFKIIKDEEEIENKLLKIIDYRCFIDDVLFNNEYKNIDYDIEKSDFYYSKNVVAFKYYYIDENEEEKVGIIFYNINEGVIRNKTTVPQTNDGNKIVEIKTVDEMEDDIFIFNVISDYNQRKGFYLYNYYKEDIIKKIEVEYSGSYSFADHCCYIKEKQYPGYLETYASTRMNFYIRKTNNAGTYSDYDEVVGTSSLKIRIQGISGNNLLKSSNDKSYIIFTNNNRRYIMYITYKFEKDKNNKYIIEEFNNIKEKGISNNINTDIYFINKQIQEIENEDKTYKRAYMKSKTNKDKYGVYPKLIIDYHDTNIECHEGDPGYYTIRVPNGEIIPLKIALTDCDYFLNNNDITVKWYKDYDLVAETSLYYYAIANTWSTYQAEVYVNNISRWTNFVTIIPF